MSERKLKSRPRRPSSKGHVIRVSDHAYNALNNMRRERSWDSFIRTTFGLADRTGRRPYLVEGMLETLSGIFVLRLPETTWLELEETVYKMSEAVARKRRIRVPSKPIRMRELR